MILSFITVIIDQDFYAEAGYSEINVDRVDLFKFPSVKEIPWTWATLRRQDCIYIPPGDSLLIN